MSYETPEIRYLNKAKREFELAATNLFMSRQLEEIPSGTLLQPIDQLILRKAVDQRFHAIHPQFMNTVDVVVGSGRLTPEPEELVRIFWET